MRNPSPHKLFNLLLACLFWTQTQTIAPLKLNAATARSSASSVAQRDRVRKNVRYSTQNPSCVGDIYMPSDPKGPVHPAVVIVHGGAWRSGSKEDFNAVEASEWLANSGFVAFNINYRLTSNGGEFPNNISDVERAVDYLGANCKALAIDKSRIGIFGASAGGHLALMTAYAPPGQKSKKLIKAVVAFCPLTDLADMPVAFVVQYLGCIVEQDGQTYAKASPVSYIETSVPTMLVHGTRDKTVPISQSIKLARLLKQNETKVEFVKLSDEDHMFSLRNSPTRIIALKDMVEFFQQNL